MTKPVTGVAMMILYEQGKWNPNDPIAKYIPEFANLKVYKGDANGQMVTEAPQHPPTMAELMSHTAGFTYGLFGNTAIDKMYMSAAVFAAPDLKDFIDRLAKIPLLYQPGTKWVYSVSVDIQGYIVEKISGKPLGAFLRENIFDPLGMKDTGFHVDPAKMGRLATLYTMNAGALSANTGGNLALNYTKEPGMPSGGGGLVSTASDYLRFAQMLVQGGQLDGVRILAPSSVALMRSNRLPHAVRDANEFGIGFFRINPGMGFGFDFGVFDDPAFISRSIGKGSYTWEGAAGTWFWVDPTNDLIFVGMVQRMLDAKSPDLSLISQTAVYQALLNPEK
jgi:CubicO group peptidase (beta-lactamase class C family)